MGRRLQPFEGRCSPRADSCSLAVGDADYQSSVMPQTHADSYGSSPITNVGRAQNSLTVSANPGYDLTASDTSKYVPKTSSPHRVATPVQCAYGSDRPSGTCDPERPRQRQCE